MKHAFLVHNEGDHVGVAVVDIEPGEEVTGLVMESGREVTVRSRARVPLGHKLALQDLAVGEAVRKYRTPIGRLTAPVRAGDHVHTHNLRSARW